MDLRNIFGFKKFFHSTIFLEPVNRNSSTNDDNIENYQVELKKLKKQFENDNAVSLFYIFTQKIYNGL